MFSQTDEFKLGEKAYNDGRADSENPYLKKLDFISKMKCVAWNRGFKHAENQYSQREED